MAKLSFQGQSESVRDVQFNPFYANYFAACFDNGNIQVLYCYLPTPFLCANIPFCHLMLTESYMHGHIQFLIVLFIHITLK